MKRLLGVAAVVAAIGVAMPAAAATCSAFENAGVSPLSATTPNCFKDSGNDSAGTLNGNAVFGYTDWVNLARDNSVDDALAPDEGNAAAFSVLGGGDRIDGSWSIFDTSHGEYALVLKIANSYLAYLVSGFSGSWESRILNNSGKGQEISHITLYARGSAPPDPGPGPVPLPGALPLVATALAGLGILRLRRRR